MKKPSQEKDPTGTNPVIEDCAKSPAGFRRLPLKWWELLTYVLILVLACVCSAIQSAQWVVVPLVVAVLLVRVTRIRLDRRKATMNQEMDSATDPVGEDLAQSPASRFADWLKWGAVFLGAGVGAFLGVVAYVRHWIS
ncbi:hypothetical protein JS528_00875 [Bifidobacterium sp. MA2]|uniref:Uncharacterized protein n=1 Tax=Bifidobacterium santillanense TaxID=2809028 RepID=A0ABS5UM58_9BIFI|nr:hypothetical protein [Bifidobacterium santillanense]MBT1171932.1 hypothetical protein [Bifidobacterium santillanense]